MNCWLYILIASVFIVVINGELLSNGDPDAPACDMDAIRSQAESVGEVEVDENGGFWSVENIGDQLVVDLQRAAVHSLNTRHVIRKFKRGEVLEAYSKVNNCTCFSLYEQHEVAFASLHIYIYIYIYIYIHIYI